MLHFSTSSWLHSEPCKLLLDFFVSCNFLNCCFCLPLRLLLNLCHQSRHLVDPFFFHLCLLITAREEKIKIRLRLPSQPGKASSNVLFRTEYNVACLQVNLG